MKLFVIVPTVGRAALVQQTISRLAEQTRRPDGVLVVGADPKDVAGIEAADLPLKLELAPRGLCSQRNHALRILADKADLIVFFDDDFVPAPDYLAQAEALFETRPGVVGACGLVLDDGVRGPGISFEGACEIVAADAGLPREGARIHASYRALYGCNMVVRVSAIGDLRFDENLPLYGWQEDIDFSVQLSARGDLVMSETLRGVHMGIKSGRQPGAKLGYSQIANIVYLLEKRTIPRRMAYSLLARNCAANLVKAFKPEPYIDRKGRLAGNLLAVRDMLTGRMHPNRILDLG
jgi:GT2 family glycosyltransferase